MDNHEAIFQSYVYDNVFVTTYLPLQLVNYPAHSSVHGRHHAAVYPSLYDSDVGTVRVDVMLRHFLGPMGREEGHVHEKRVLLSGSTDDLHSPISYQICFVVTLVVNSMHNINKTSLSGLRNLHRCCSWLRNNLETCQCGLGTEIVSRVVFHIKLGC